MSLSFDFATATEIRFGRGRAAEAAPRAAAMGKHVLLVHGANASRADWLADALTSLGSRVERLSIAREPDVPMIEAALEPARRADVVLALGGGAVIDAGKALAALAPTHRLVMDHLEVIGKGLPLDRAPLPFIAVPTTAGTGSEVTRNAVLGVPLHRRKVSLRDARMLPRLAIVDPTLTDNCPRAVTLASGLDAVTQVIEPFLSPRATPITDALCRDAIPRGLRAIRRLMEVEDPAARDEMAWVSLCGGLALANAGLGVVHGLAGPLGGLTSAPHGAICGALLPHALVMNHRRMEDPVASDRMTQVAGWIHAALGSEYSDLESAAEALAAWSRAAGLPGLAALGADEGARATAARMAAGSSSMAGNPVALSDEDLCTIMRRAI